MKIVLLKEVKNLGHAGEIKEVKQGYARNFLIPQGLADILTKHNLSILETGKKKKDTCPPYLRRQGRQGNKKLLAKKLTGKNFVIQAKADDKGSLYAKVDAKVIAQELQKQGFAVEAKEIILDKVVKKTGEYVAELKLGEEKAMIKVKVSAKVGE